MGQNRGDRGRGRVLASYRRFLVDMHVPDWDSEFMARMDPEQLIDRVAEASATVITVPANNHAGLNFFPSSVGAAHRGRGCGDLLPRLLDAAQARGIGSVIYYCLTYVDWFWRHYPGARVVDAAGRARRIRVPSTGEADRFGVCCINNADYREFALTQVAELASWYAPDGFNLDMTFWPGVCFCAACRDRARAEMGFDIPTVVDWGNDSWLTFADARRRWLAEFVEALSGVVRQHRPNASLTHQSGGYVDDWGGGASERLSESADWLSADLYQDRASLSVSLKLFERLSRHHPAELIQSWCAPTIFEHSATKTSAEILDSAAAAISNGTALSIIEAINPDGSTSAERYHRARPVLEFVAQLEPILGGDRLADVAIYRSFVANFDPAESGRRLTEVAFLGEPAYRRMKATAHRLVVTSVGETFIERHQLFTVITRLDLDQLWNWKLVMLPNVMILDDVERAALTEYVRGGGCIYVSLSGQALDAPNRDSALGFVQELLDVDIIGRSEGGVTYMAPTADGEEVFAPFVGDRPYTLHSDQLYVRSGARDVRCLALVGLPFSDPRGGRYASTLTDPVGRSTAYPALLERQVGRGRVLFASGPMEAETPTEQRDAFARLVATMFEPTLEVVAPACIEVTAFSRPDLGATSLFFYNSQRTAPPVPVRGIRVAMAGAKRPASIRLVPGDKPLRWEGRPKGFDFELPECETLAVAQVTWSTTAQL
jgi:Hypothetical glycosyl hydrolase 6